MPGQPIDLGEVMHVVCYVLTGIYSALFLWSLRKIIILQQKSRILTKQKGIHFFIALICMREWGRWWHWEQGMPQNGTIREQSSACASGSPSAPQTGHTQSQGTSSPP